MEESDPTHSSGMELNFHWVRLILERCLRNITKQNFNGIADKHSVALPAEFYKR
jgi:hypothetical protein